MPAVVATGLTVKQDSPFQRESPSEYRRNVWYGKTRTVWLPDGEKISNVRLLVSTEYTNATDRQTEGHCATA